MTALLFSLLLWNLPGFITGPSGLLRVLLLLAISFILDAAVHFLIYKRPVCPATAAVTALVLYTLSSGAPVLLQCLALLAALVIGKLIWGGTGKNPLNPAMLGMALLAFFAPLHNPPFSPSFALLPAVLLSVPFLFVRPWAGLGMMLGMAASLLLKNELTPAALLAWGVPFWGCLVITDPVTTTARPAAGFVIGAAAGLIPMVTGNTPAALPLAILISNIMSWQADRLRIGNAEKLRKTFGRGQRIGFSPGETPFIDLTGPAGPETAEESPDRDVILKRIQNNNVTGCGGAAFPAVRKIRAAMDTSLSGKHLIVNAAECDPGLIHDKWLLTHSLEEVRKGIALLMKCVPFKSVTVAAKSFYTATFEPPVRMHRVRDYYPAGAEKLLIRDVLNIALKPDEIPAECGILVLNIQTIAALSAAARFNRRADTRYLTVADLGSLKGTVVKARLGDSAYEMARRVFPGAVNVHIGGGAMSARLADDGALIDEKTNFLCIGGDGGFREALCSRCLACDACCPAFLPVREISQRIDEGKPARAAQLKPEVCIECNLCSAVCPAGRDQAKRVKQAKRLMK
jgi:Na+-translocating ferredoxin:NAD+ oxidoreductase RnfD subunit